MQTTTLTALLTAATLSSLGTAQDVILSEIEPGESWIELHNRSAEDVDLSTWSLYLATETVAAPQNYWWGFPGGSTIPAHGYLRVHWMSPRPLDPLPGEIHTGETNVYFLFGLGTEPLPADRGAMALLRSNQNASMNTPSVFADWVSWGAPVPGNPPLRREDLAEQAGLWLVGHATPEITAGFSLARDPNVAAPQAPAQRWFRDGTPTPLLPNTGQAEVQVVGAPCAPAGHRLLGAPELVATSSPLIGNGDFSLIVTNTTGLLFETCAVGFALAESPATAASLLPPDPAGLSCRQWIDPTTMFSSLWTDTDLIETELPFSLQFTPAALVGVRFSVQAVVFDNWPNGYPPYQGVTNALTITLGN